MPELPEVETTRRGLERVLTGARIVSVAVHDARLRWPIAPELGQRATGARIAAIARRAKYLLVRFGHAGTLLAHLGMSGSFRRDARAVPRPPHDHVEFTCEPAGGSTVLLRYNDPRRFGSMHWLDDEAAGHFLLDHLGPEPLALEPVAGEPVAGEPVAGEPDGREQDAGADSAAVFGGALLHARARGRRGPVKSFLMDARIVVGVGNIYANEALYLAGIHPKRPAGRISRARYDALADAVRSVLQRAVDEGGTTLRDFVDSDGQPGYFAQSLEVYGRGGQRCRRCDATLKEIRITDRTTVYCPACQR